MKILITGAFGFIGSHLVEKLRDSHELILVDDLSSGSKENIPDYHHYHCYFKSISENLERLFEVHRPELIYHLAAVSSVQDCNERPDYATEVNLNSSQRLVDLAVRFGTKKFIFASSAAVYGDHPELPKKENSPQEAISLYGKDKLAAERYILSQNDKNGMKSTAFRFFNVYGPRQNPNSPYSGVLSIFFDRFKTMEKPHLTVYGDGLQTRDFIFVKDIVHGLELPLKHQKMEGQVYNLATGRSLNLLSIIEILEALFHKKAQIDFKPARVGDIKISSANVDKVNAFDFNPEYDLQSGLDYYYRYTTQ